MEPDYGHCDLCKKGKLVFVEKKEVAGSGYNVVKCSKCHHEKAKRIE